jgi:hypothetical protein
LDLFTQLFGGLLAFVYHCFDRIVIYGYLSGLSRPERVVNFFHQVVGVPVLSREILSQRTADSARRFIPRWTAATNFSCCSACVVRRARRIPGIPSVTASNSISGPSSAPC